MEASRKTRDVVVKKELEDLIAAARAYKRVTDGCEKTVGLGMPHERIF